MLVKDLVDFLKNLDQDKNIFLVYDRYDRYEFQQPDVDVLSEKELGDFSIPDYLLKITPENELPHVGDYFFDAF